MNNIIVTIDGPAGSGKTTVAKEVAKRLGFLYLDTGAMYRAMTLKALNKKIQEEDEKKLVEMVKETNLSVMKPATTTQAGRPVKQDRKGKSATPATADKPASGVSMRIWLDGEEVTDKIRTEEVTNNVWWVCKVKEVREKMKNIQRQVGSNGEIVVEGRDIGTVIFPDAPYKFYLDASIEERAKRRWLEQKEKGMGTSDMEKLKEDIEIRDRRDIEREIAPLKKAEDAIHVDTTGLTIEQVIEEIVSRVQVNNG